MTLTFRAQTSGTVPSSASAPLPRHRMAAAQHFRSLALATLLAGALCACGSSSDAGLKTGGSGADSSGTGAAPGSGGTTGGSGGQASVPACVNGSSKSCVCTTGATGTQTCVGGVYAACQCGGSGSGGSGGATNASDAGGGSGGTAGSGGMTSLPCTTTDLSSCVPPSGTTACCTSGGECGYLGSTTTGTSQVCLRFIPTALADPSCDANVLGTPITGCCFPDGVCGVLDSTIGGCRDSTLGAGVLGTCTPAGSTADASTTASCPGTTLGGTTLAGCCTSTAECGFVVYGSCTARQNVSMAYQAMPCP